MRRGLALLIGLGLLGCRGEERPFPSRPITLICPPAPGGISDTLTRSLAAMAQPVLGVPVVVENKPGGANAVGLTYGAHASPDGYTVTYLVAELAILPHLHLSAVTAEDFDLLARTNYNPAAVTVRSDSPWHRLSQLLAEAKARPGQIRVGNSGTGSIWHLAAAALQEASGVEFKHVPFSGAALAVQALLGGHVDVVCVSPTEVQSQVEAGALRMLALLASQRDPLFPQVPTAKELGLEVDIGAWGGLAVPKGTPEPVKEKLLTAFREAFRNPKFVKMMEERGIRLAWLEGEEFARFLQRQSEQNRRLVEALGLQLTAGDVGAEFFPRLLLALLVLLGALVGLGGKRRRASASEEEARAGRSVAMAGLTLAYILALGRMGFLGATTLFLALAMGGLGQRRWGRVIAVAALGSVAVWLLFVWLLKVPLP